MKRPLLLFAALILACLQASAQDPSISDSLEQQIDAHPELDTTHVDLLHKLAISQIYMDPGGKALEASKRATQIADSLHDTLRWAKSLNLLGNCYKNIQLPDRALMCFLQALPLFEAVHDLKWVANLHSNIGGIYLDRGDLKQALKEQRMALELREQIKYYKAISGTYNAMGNIFTAMNKDDEALRYYLLALDSSANEHNPLFTALYLGNIGNCHGRRQQGVACRKYNRMALEIHLAAGLKAETARDLHNIAESFQNEERMDSALHYQIQSIQIARELKYYQLMALGAVNLMATYDKLGRPAEALGWAKYALEFQDSVNRHNAQGEAETLETAYRLDQAEKEAIFQRETQLIQKDAKLKRQRILSFSLVFITLLLAGFGFIATKRYREKQQANALLEARVAARTEELRLANEHLQAEIALKDKANQTLRTFLYRSSHDIKGPLASIRGLVDVATAEQVQSQYIPMIGLKVQQLDGVLQQLVESLEIESRQPQPTLLDLDAVWQSALQAVSSRPGFDQLSFSNLTDPGSTLVADRELLLAALIPLLRNAIDFRRIDASDGKVSLSGIASGTGKWSLELADNGIGLPPQGIPEDTLLPQRDAQSQGAGLGLHLARAAAAKLGAKLTLQTRKSDTVVLLSTT